MENKNIFDSKLFGIIILSVTGLIVISFVFGVGVFVGMKKADFSFKWANEYHHNFGGPQGGFLGNMMSQDFTNSNGVFGKIIKIDISGENTALTINDKDNVEKIVSSGNETTVRFQRRNEKVSDLKVGDSIVVVGEPQSNGQIEAELIRVMPAAPSGAIVK